MAPAQLQVYQDQWEQWVVEDLGKNGLTMVGRAPLNHERSMPWHDLEIKVGPAVFRWNCFPAGLP